MGMKMARVALAEFALKISALCLAMTTIRGIVVTRMPMVFMVITLVDRQGGENHNHEEDAKQHFLDAMDYCLNINTFEWAQEVNEPEAENYFFL